MGCLFAGLLLWCLHPWLLTRLGRSLIAGDSVRSVDVLLVLDGRPGYEFAEHLLSEGQAGQLLLFDKVHSRVVELGVLPTSIDLCRDLVEELHIPVRQVAELPGQMTHLDQLLDSALRHLGPEQTLAVVCSEWRSAYVRVKLSRAATRNHCTRPLLFLVDDPEADPENWWQTRHGIRLVCDQLMRCTSLRLAAETHDASPISAEQFRRAAVATHEAPPSE
ncbi:MAG: hypothetical protein KDA58_01525 [Planctomycetaceae bacterium]|nr:hypothetical protein [Planctomycetaceae bacterium]